jgi:hypothetical protein
LIGVTIRLVFSRCFIPFFYFYLTSPCQADIARRNTELDMPETEVFTVSLFVPSSIPSLLAPAATELDMPETEVFTVNGQSLLALHSLPNQTLTFIPSILSFFLSLFLSFFLYSFLFFFLSSFPFFSLPGGHSAPQRGAGYARNRSVCAVPEAAIEDDAVAGTLSGRSKRGDGDGRAHSR